MADFILLAINCLWAAVTAYAITKCSAWITGRVDVRAHHDKELAETRKTVEYIKSELEKLRAIPSSKPTRF